VVPDRERSNKIVMFYYDHKRCEAEEEMDILSQLRKFKGGNKKGDNSSYEDFLTAPVTASPLKNAKKKKQSTNKELEGTVSAEQRKALLSIIHVLDPNHRGISKKHSEAIVKYLVSASLADTDDKREKRLFELEYGADALAEIEDDEARANLNVDDMEDADNDGSSSDGSAGSLKDFVVEEEDDEDDEDEEHEEHEEDGEDEDGEDDEEAEEDDEEDDEEDEEEDGVTSTIVEGAIPESHDVDDKYDEEGDKEEEGTSHLPTAKRAKTSQNVL